VESMTTDQLTAEQKEKSDVLPIGFWNDHGWGYGMSVTTAADARSSGKWRYGWDGGLGTSWRSDPREDAIAILLTQRAAFPVLTGVYRDFWQGVYKCIQSG